MRLFAGFVAIAVLLSGWVRAGDLMVIGPQSSVDQILDALDQRGGNLQGFEAAVKLTEEDQATGQFSVQVGKVLFQKTGEADARLRVDLQRLGKDQKPTADKDLYLLDQGWSTERHYRRRSEIRRQVLRPGEKINLLKLGEGPFPLPIGQDKSEVHKQFEVSKVAPAQDDPAGTVHLQLKPRPDTRFVRRFATIDVWVDTKNNMPVRIVTLDSNETTLRTTELSDLRVNPELKDADFRLPSIGDDWQRTEEAYSDE